PSHPDVLDLHSFPTRRSSDLFHFLRQGLGRNLGFRGLPRGGHDLDSGTFREIDTLPNLPGEYGLVLLPHHIEIGQGTFVEGPERSEEHTSELQSRENLVCRLL